MAYYSGNNIFGYFPELNEIIIENFAKFNFEDMNFQFTTVPYICFTNNINEILIFGFLNSISGQKKIFDQFKNKSIQCITGNEKYILVLEQNGELWKINLNDNTLKKIDNCLNIDKNINDSAKDPDKIIKIIANNQVNLALTSFGKIYNIPVKLSECKDIIDLCYGKEHGLFLSSNGQVFSWGNGSRGQLGHDELTEEQTPRLIEALDGIKIVKISCGGWHSIVLSDTGDVYTWGWNVNGQLGLGETDIQVVMVPKLVTFNNNIDIIISDISCGYRHTLVLTNDFKLFGCGSNKYNQLTSSMKLESIFKMSLIKPMIEENIKQIKCAPYGSFLFSKS